MHLSDTDNCRAPDEVSGGVVPTCLLQSVITDLQIGRWVGLSIEAFCGRSLGSPTGKPACFSTTHSLLVGSYVDDIVCGFDRAPWYPVEQGRAEEEPRSSGALDWGDGQAGPYVVLHHCAIPFWTRHRHQLDSSRRASSSSRVVFVKERVEPYRSPPRDVKPPTLVTPGAHQSGAFGATVAVIRQITTLSPIRILLARPL